MAEPEPQSEQKPESELQLQLESRRKKTAHAYLSRRKAIGIFKDEEDFNKFLQREEFIKKLSALSYLESVKKNQGKYVVHLYFRDKNRLTALTTTFAFGQFEADYHPKRKEFHKRNQLSKFIRDFQQKNNIVEVIKNSVKPKQALKNKRTDFSFALAEDNKAGQGRGSKRVKVPLPSDPKKNKRLRDVPKVQILYQENKKLRQGLRDFIDLFKDLQPFLPPLEAKKLQGDLKEMEDLCESPCVSQIAEEDAFNLDGKDLLDDHDQNHDHDQDQDKTSNISKFFAKEIDHDNQLSLGTSPVLMATSVVAGTDTLTACNNTVIEEEKKAKARAGEEDEGEKNVQPEPEETVAAPSQIPKISRRSETTKSPGKKGMTQKRNSSKKNRTKLAAPKEPLWSQLSKGVLTIWQAIKAAIQLGKTEEQLRQDKNTAMNWRPVLDPEYDLRQIFLQFLASDCSIDVNE